jgi:hypothetical protein
MAWAVHARQARGQILYHIVSYPIRMSDYVECPFCDRIFEADTYPALVHEHPLEDHIRIAHDKVRVRKGSNYRWVDKTEVESRLERSRTARVVVAKGKQP